MTKAQPSQPDQPQALESQVIESAEGNQLLKLFETIAVLSSQPLPVEELLSITLQQICFFTNWSLGHVFLVDTEKPDQLTSSDIWEGQEVLQFADFCDLTSRLNFQLGIGLPGQVMESKQPQVFNNLRADPRFQLARPSRSTGLKMGVAFPALAGEEVVAVFEFFSRQGVLPDEEMLATFGHIGAILGPAVERQRSLERLQESEQRFRHLVQSTREYAIITLDPHGRITSWNDGAEAIYGYESAEIIDKHFSCFHLPAERRGRAPANALKAAFEQGVYQGEGWRVRKDGTRFWASVVVTPLRDDQEQLRGFSKVVRDMTVRKQFENALKRQAALLKLLQDVTVMANEATQVREVIQFALERICQFMGWQIGLAFEVTDTAWGELQVMPVYYMAEDSRLKYLLDASMETHLSAGEGLPGAVWATGAYVWSKDLAFEPLFTLQEAAANASVQMSVAFPVLAGKVVTHVLQFFASQATEPDVDLLEAITHLGTQLGRVVERQISEDALRSSEVRFRSIFQNAAIGIELVDLDRNLLACNPAIARIFGYSLEEIHATALLRPDHDINIVHQDRNFERLRSGKLDEYTLERAYKHAAGHVIWGRSKVSLVRDANNNPQYAVCMLEDVTDQKQMEIEMREMRQRLSESREAERLHLAQELHDGPIQDLYGLTYTLKAFEDRVPPAMDTTSLKEMQIELKRVARTLRSMNGELRPPTLAPFGLEKAIRSHAQDFKEAHPELELCLDLMPDGQKLPENVRLALFRIYQASLANVLRHAEASRVDILLEYDENHVRLEIYDNGKGFIMPPRLILLARKGHLGLIGAMERAEAIGGKLEIESELGSGTRVRVLVPLGDKPDPKSS